MRSFDFILIVCAITFLFSVEDSQGLDQTKSVPSLFQHISRARKAASPNQIITAREAEPLTKCEKLRDEALGKGKQVRYGRYVPQCREDGSFEPKQCWASTGYCWCVDKNGTQINGTLTPPGQELHCNEPADPLTKCEKLRDEALGKGNQVRSGLYVPQCREDGSFEPMQCWGSTGYCWCVDKNGNQINGTLTPPVHAQELHCNEQAEPLTKCEKLREEALGNGNQVRPGLYVPQCREDGSFEPKQCWGSTGYCWCVDKDGNQINGTLTPPVHAQELHCNEQDEPLTKCEKLHNEALAKKEHGAMTIYVPQCTEDGSFEPKQCDGSIGYCWCVDENGKEIPGTRTKFGHAPPLECLLTSEEKKRAEAKYEKLRAEAHKNPEKRHRHTDHRKTKLV